ncbi:hypothetical protein GCM10017687_14360 [Streptomyces echinatus]
MRGVPAVAGEEGAGGGDGGQHGGGGDGGGPAAAPARARRRGVGRGGLGAGVGQPALAEQVQELVGAGTGLGVLLQAEADEGQQVGGDAGQVGVALDHPGRGLPGARAVEGTAPGGGVRDDGAEGEDVGGRADLVRGGELLGGT